MRLRWQSAFPVAERASCTNPHASVTDDRARSCPSLGEAMTASQDRPRQSSLEIVVTPEMLAAGVQALNEYINMDDARPIYSEEEIVEFIFKAMAQRLGDRGTLRR
jgi:hypothetical protein